MDKKELQKKKQELERDLKQVNQKLEKLSEPVMIQLGSIDLTSLIKILQNVMKDYKEEGRSKDDTHYIYESVMTTFYGPNVFDWINAQGKKFG